MEIIIVQPIYITTQHHLRCFAGGVEFGSEAVTGLLVVVNKSIKAGILVSITASPDISLEDVDIASSMVAAVFSPAW